MNGFCGMAQGQMSSILVTIGITVRIQESEVRNPDSLDYRKSYQRILMNFYGETGCGLVSYILVTIRITIRIRKSFPDHDPDPGRTATLSMLAFGGGLCSLLIIHLLFGNKDI